MRAAGSTSCCLVVAALVATSCSHVRNEDRYPTRAQVLRLAGGCKKLEALRGFETGLFKQGFLRKQVREREGAPVPYELVEDLVNQTPRLVEFVKTDFEAIEGSSQPYRETRNRYKITACEEPAGDLFVVVVRHDPEQGHQFLGTRFVEALRASGCTEAGEVAKPRALGLYEESTEEDLLTYVRRGRCRDYARTK